MPDLFPTAEQVAVGWISSISGVPTGKVATKLPSDATTWAADGFITVLSVGGSPDSLYVPVRAPVVQIDFWANNTGSAKPPWGKAGSLANLVINKTFLDPQPQNIPVLPNFRNIRLMSVYPTTEPRRVPADEAGFARYQTDLIFKYIIIPTK